jgi:predicted permease
VLSVQLSLPPERYGEPAVVAGFYDELLRRVAALPGARAAGATWALPFGEQYAAGTFVPADGRVPETAPVRGDFFRALGMRLVRGRAFGPDDSASAPPVIVVNETLARLFWPGENPLGKQILEADPEGRGAPWTVVGVVADVKRHALHVAAEPEAYQPQEQAAWSGGDLYVTIRTEGEPLALAPAVRRAIRELDPLLPVLQVADLSDLVARSVAEPRFLTTVLGGFSTIASLLGLVGVYGVLALATALRHRDIAVRMALGAARVRVLREVLYGGMRLVALGVVLGLAGAVFATRSLSALLFGITPLDAPTYVVTIAALCTAAAAACWVPARRAARMDALTVLREE